MKYFLYFIAINFVAFSLIFFLKFLGSYLLYSVGYIG